MRNANGSQRIFLAALLLLMFVAGCGGGTKQNGTGTRPTVISAIPPSSASGACPNTLVTVTFSKAMKASSINSTSYTLSGPGSVAVPGLVTYDAASHTAIFTPSATLALNTVYTATVTTAPVDLSGNALASDMVSSFTTGSTTCQPGAADCDLHRSAGWYERHMSEHRRRRYVRYGDESRNYQCHYVYGDRSGCGLGRRTSDLRCAQPSRDLYSVQLARAEHVLHGYREGGDARPLWQFHGNCIWMDLHHGCGGVSNAAGSAGIGR